VVVLLSLLPMRPPRDRRRVSYRRVEKEERDGGSGANGAHCQPTWYICISGVQTLELLSGRTARSLPTQLLSLVTCTRAWKADARSCMFVQWMISTKLPSMHLVGEVWAGAVGGLSGGLGPVLRSEKYADPTHTACLVCLLCTVYCLRSVDIVELVKKTLRVEIYIHAVMNEGHEVAIARKAQSPGKLDDWSRGTSRRARTTS
jgi:hypothetical protein